MSSGHCWNRGDEGSRRRDGISAISSDFWDTKVTARRNDVVERRWLETGGDQPHGLSTFPCRQIGKRQRRFQFLVKKSSKIRAIDAIHSTH
jgi:hypothetical protein